MRPSSTNTAMFSAGKFSAPSKMRQLLKRVADIPI
jgi:hypothetical protein